MKFVKPISLCLLFLLISCDHLFKEKTSSSDRNDPQAVKTSLDLPIEENKSEEGNAFKEFYVYADMGFLGNHYVPSGFMPNGKCLKLNERWQDDCQSGTTCIKIIYDIQCSMDDQNWSGIFWLNPPNNWGNQKGGFNLTGAKKLTFWAKGENGGERIEEFKVGGIMGEYPDSDMAMIGPVILGDEWREYSIDLRGKDLSYVSGGFSWATNVDVNPESCTFYLDHIVYE